MPFSGAVGKGERKSIGPSVTVEVGVLAEAKGKAETLYYVTLEVRGNSRATPP